VTVLGHVGCLLLGAAVGLGAVVVHRSGFPWGLTLALATTFAAPWWLLASRRPRTAGSYAVGWLAVLGLALVGRPEGDYVVAGDLAGYALMAAGLVLVPAGIVAFAGGRVRSTTVDT
jgi:hypothetical protein